MLLKSRPAVWSCTFPCPTVCMAVNHVAFSWPWQDLGVSCHLALRITFHSVSYTTLACLSKVHGSSAAILGPLEDGAHRAAPVTVHPTDGKPTIQRLNLTREAGPTADTPGRPPTRRGPRPRPRPPHQGTNIPPNKNNQRAGQRNRCINWWLWRVI